MSKGIEDFEPRVSTDLIRQYKKMPEHTVERRVAEIITAPSYDVRFIPDQNAKEAYGFRATNFEIQEVCSRPTKANQEGRE